MDFRNYSMQILQIYSFSTLLIGGAKNHKEKDWDRV
jgi:hypothetical protein